MPFLPARRNDGDDAAVALRRANIAIFNNELDTYVVTEREKAWDDATVEVCQYAAEREMEMADRLITKANGSPVKQAIAARKIALADDINSQRIIRTMRRQG